jgi:ankyrin repeat protein
MRLLSTSTAVSLLAAFSAVTVSGGAVFAQEAAPPPTAAGPASAPPPGDPLGPDLYAAVRTANIPEIKKLVAGGARLEGRNWLGITPLLWASAIGNREVCATLIDAGAKVDAPSRYGTALSAAAMGGHTSVVRLLLDHGASANPERTDDISPLMMAAEIGDLEMVRLLLAHKAVVNMRDFNGVTPLMFAARRGQTATAKLLLQSGAKINAADTQGRTALMYAALNGHAECTSFLVTGHAAVNARDHNKDTALHLAARYSGDTAVAQALVRAGADRAAVDAKGRTACRIAVAHSNRGFAAMTLPVSQALPKTAVKQVSLAEQARSAALRGLPRIESSARRFASQAACVSCHHEGLGLMTSGLAKKRGFPYDRTLVATQIGKILQGDEANGAALHGLLPHPEMFKHIPGVDMGEFTPGISFLYSGLLAHAQPAGQTQKDAVQVVASQQFPDGRWGFYLRREPIQSSDFTTTALTIRLMRSYFPSERRAEAEERVGKARAWLVSARPVTHEDRTYRLLGLKWAGASANEIARAARELTATQRPDGGWAQMPAPGAGPAYQRSDAYATGQALYALNTAGGMPTTSECYRRGVRYLIRTQDDDGTWFVNKRAVPVNTFLEAGFPHGESQYISYGASCWATMALMLASPPPASTAPVARAPRPKARRVAVR